MLNKAVFFDKDGVLNIDKGISAKIEEVQLYEHVSDVIAELSKRGYKIFIVTNQPIVARGLITEHELQKYFIKFESLLKMTCTRKGENKKVEIEKIYYCPHHPNADVIQYRTNCDCRKPKPGMILKAGKEYVLDLKKSYMIGDRISDIIAGHLAGCKTILCETGMHKEKLIITDLNIKDNIEPDYKVNTIKEILDIIL